MKKHYSLRMRICGFFLTLLMTVGVFLPHVSPKVYAENTDESYDINLEDYQSYEQYLTTYSKASHPYSKIEIAGGDFITTGSDSGVHREENYLGQKNIAVWPQNEGYVEWSVSVPESGFYCLNMNYYSLNPDARYVEFKISIDGKIPFDLANGVMLSRLFHNETAIKTDERGNDVRPDQVAYDAWISNDISDKSGISNSPLLFYFEKGSHNLRFTGIKANVAISKITLFNETELPSYKTYSANAKVANTKSPIMVQAENTQYTSDSVLYPTNDNSDAETVPSDPVKIKLNTVGGGDNFSKIGQYISWNVNVEESGYYKIGIRYLQNTARGLTSYRRLYVNGEVPFNEADAIGFDFSDKWQNKVLGDGWLFKLNKGDNEIKLEVIAGPAGSLISNMQNIVSMLNQQYRKIIMITSVSPDSYRDYQLDQEIPDLIPQLEAIRDLAITAYQNASKMGSGKSSEYASMLNQITVLLNEFIDKPDKIPVNLSNLKSNISSLSTLVLNLKSQPLEIDYISFSSKEDDLFQKSLPLLSRINYSLRSFFGSFTEDYNSIGSAKSDQQQKPVNVWINLGRDQAQIIKNLVDSQFTPQTNISVNVNLVQQSVVQATLSGKGPDMILFVGEADPVNLAARNALCPMSDFDGFENIKTRFSECAFTPFEYLGKTYAIPLTQTFQMMFCRTDIFKELNLQIPTTWDELYEVCQVLGRKNMQVGVNANFATLMKQRGMNYYNDQLTSTNFTTKEAVDSFKQWTGFYLEYGVPFAYDFFNRFRSGEMPLGLSSYTLYNQLSVGAPEIQDCWMMAPIPGIQDENGKINNICCANSTATIILKNAKSPENAWKLIEWFTSDKIQTTYGLTLESILGPSGRYDTANLNAFKGLPWTDSEQQLIKRQWNSIFQLPQVPGGYFIDRDINNAYRQVVFYNKNAREMLLSYNEDINSEIERKRKEFGLSTD